MIITNIIWGYMQNITTYLRLDQESGICYTKNEEYRNIINNIENLLYNLCLLIKKVALLKSLDHSSNTNTTTRSFEKLKA